MKKIELLITAIPFLTACGDPNALPSGGLTGNMWRSDSQLSELYASNNINVDISLKFTGEKGRGSVEVYEGSSLSKSCVCNGSYNLGSDRKSLQISGLNNDNCPWMNKLNGIYTFRNEDGILYFIKGSIKIKYL